ncbi:MAG: nucleotidyltransferase family protein [Candidatus Riflebacteria bacterium]|nr:nucleotidyltransferase family protein [Candidatus Riflebacteria bacterium]
MTAQLEKILIKPATSILDTLKVIDEAAFEIALVVDEDFKLLGTVTDGDIRRGIIRGADLQSPIADLMNRQPVVAGQNTTDDELLFMMTNRSIKHLPVVDRNNRVIKLVQLKNLIAREPRANIAVIMAGGLGSRLGNITREIPKPLLPVGNRPIIALIVEQLRRHGIEKIYISINYRAAKIKDYFTENPIKGANISYLEEKEFLGTAGSLTLLPERSKQSLIVMNGDILSPVNFGNLLDFHATARKPMTLCTREFNFQIPYGVLQMRGDNLVDIEEKPTHSIFINAGIYVLEPTLLDLIKPQQRLDMTDLIKEVNASAGGVSCFPVSEFWLDIGSPIDYARAHESFAEISSHYE